MKNDYDEIFFVPIFLAGLIIATLGLWKLAEVIAWCFDHVKIV
jgi:hypothetical protein